MSTKIEIDDFKTAFSEHNGTTKVHILFLINRLSDYSNYWMASK